MGLFDFLKEKPPKSKAKAKITIEMYGYENGKRVELPKGTTCSTEDWKKQLSKSLTIKSEIKPIEDIIVGFAVALKKPQRIDDEILLLESLIENYKNLKKKCYSLGPEYIEYFNKSWEQALKGKPDGPSYVTRYYKRLKYIKDNYNELRKQENIHGNESKNLESRIVSVLKKSNGILQTDE